MKFVLNFLKFLSYCLGRTWNLSINREDQIQTIIRGNFMDKQRVDMYVMSNNKYFESHHIPSISHALEKAADESTFMRVQSISYKDPILLLIISLVAGPLWAWTVSWWAIRWPGYSQAADLRWFGYLDHRGLLPDHGPRPGGQLRESPADRRILVNHPSCHRSNAADHPK
jgi:hypothetical protein